MILSVIPHAATLSARPRQYSQRATLIYDAITELIKASSRNTDPVQRRGGRSGRGIKPPPAALTASSAPNNQRWESVGLQAIAASCLGDEREERSGARSRQLSRMSVHCTCAPTGEKKREKKERKRMTSWDD